MTKFLLLSFVSVLFFLSTTNSYSASRFIGGADLVNRQDELNAALSGGTIELYARARGFVPFFDIPEFGEHYGKNPKNTLMLAETQQVIPLEYVAFPNTLMRVHRIFTLSGVTLLDVTSKEYPYDSEEDRHYVDAHMVRVMQSTTTPAERKIILPSRQAVVDRMRQQVGTPYIWGGNTPTGSPQMLGYYPTSRAINSLTRAKWMMAGFDCSGLLFWATNGYTPRNTSKLLRSGTGVNIEGKTAKEIAATLKPLDIIIWPGHMQIVLDSEHVIESTVSFNHTDDFTEPNGVHLIPIVDAIGEIIKIRDRTPVNDWDASKLERTKKFVVRRWYP